jgi:hypothetical protein
VVKKKISRKKDRVMYTQTRSIKVWKDASGIGHVEFMPKSDFGSYELREYYAICKKQTGGKPTPVLMDIGNADTRDIIVTALMGKEFRSFTSAVALVGWPRAKHTQLIISFLLKLPRPNLPMQRFSNKEKAKSWLKTFLKKK